MTDFPRGEEMSLFKCKMCGGSLEIIAGTTVVQCEYCGTKQTLPRLSDERITNLYDRANHFRRNNDYDKALGIYEQILSEDRSDSEAYWSIVLCRYGIEYVEDSVNHRRIPTINRTQYTSIFLDEDYKSAILYADDAQKDIYEQEAKVIDDIQKGILEVSKIEAPFNVFICYKETDAHGRRTQDSVLATELYNELVREGYKVFLSRITLEDKIGHEYEPYIFAALNSAKVMVVVGTKSEHFNSVWVKNEWSRYLSLIRNGARKTLIPAYRDMDPYDLPEEFSHLQAQDMAKLGFMQDLVRGIKKILSASGEGDNQEEPTKNNNSVETTIDYALLLIEDGNIKKATQLLEQVVSVAPKHPLIYVGRLLIECGVQRQEDLAKLTDSFESSSNYQKAIRFANPQLKAMLEGYVETVRNNNVKSIYGQAVAKMNNGVSEEDFAQAKQLFDMILEYADAEQLSALCIDKGSVAKKEKIYQTALTQMNSNSPNRIAMLEKAKEGFLSIREYKDAAVQKDKCERLIYVEQEAIAKKKKRDKKIMFITGSAFFAMIIVSIVYFGFVLPKRNYAEAEKLFKKEDYSAAYDLYNKLGNYEDARDKAKECLYIQATVLREEHKWDEANVLFEKIQGYKDSDTLIHLHTYEEIASQDATCEAPGYKEVKCSGCGETSRSDYEATGHNYTAATCTTPRKCSTCAKTEGGALGHTDGGVKCSRCGIIIFETLKYSGRGPYSITNLNLPAGRYNITFTHSGNSNFIVQGCVSSIWVNEIGKVNYVCQVISDNYNPIKNGYINITNADGYWTISIEAIE